MTPEERADRLVFDVAITRDAADQVAEAIRAAVAEEREACARVAEGNYDPAVIGHMYHVGSRQIASAIRARK